MADEKTELREMMSKEEILASIPISRNTLLKLIKEGSFPKAHFVTPYKKLWFKDEIVRWQKALDEPKP